MRKLIVTLVLAGFIALALTTPIYAQEDPIAVLKDKNSSYLQRSEACRALALTGTAEAVPALEAQLTDPRFSHIARMALEAMPEPEARWRVASTGRNRSRRGGTLRLAAGFDVDSLGAPSRPKSSNALRDRLGYDANDPASDLDC